MCGNIKISFNLAKASWGFFVGKPPHEAQAIRKMNLPFPDLTPRLIDTKWFNADNPCDEETDLTSMEHIYQSWLTSVSQQYSKRTPLGKTAPEPMEEEAETDEEEGNDDSDESEESHDEDEDEELRTSYSPPPRTSVNNNDATANEEAMEDESTRDVQADIPASSAADDTSS